MLHSVVCEVTRESEAYAVNKLAVHVFHQDDAQQSMILPSSTKIQAVRLTKPRAQRKGAATK
jgi:hypothetical protein